MPQASTLMWVWSEPYNRGEVVEGEIAVPLTVVEERVAVDVAVAVDRERGQKRRDPMVGGDDHEFPGGGEHRNLQVERLAAGAVGLEG